MYLLWVYFYRLSLLFFLVIHSFFSDMYSNFIKSGFCIWKIETLNDVVFLRSEVNIFSWQAYHLGGIHTRAALFLGAFFFFFFFFSYLSSPLRILVKVWVFTRTLSLLGGGGWRESSELQLFLTLVLSDGKNL